MIGRRPVPCVLSIAGSDSGGGAGIQADLKAFARCGVHGTTAITAVTAQNTVAVNAVHALPADIIVAQVRAVSEDLGVDAVKIGMLGGAAVIRAVVRALDLLPASVPIVLDPVMVAESGARLLEEDATDAVVEELLPRATVVTPNLAEARILAARSALHERFGADVPVGAGHDPADSEADRLALLVHRLGPKAVVVTGGHRAQATDVFFDGEQLVAIPGERHPDGASHGSGCTHSSALAAHLARGLAPLEAARAAKAIASDAVRDGLRGLGAGAGPVDVLGLSLRP